MLTAKDLAFSLEGATIRKTEIRDGAIRLHTTSGFIVAVTADGDALNISDETSIP
jgi:hypothetical protein